MTSPLLDQDGTPASETHTASRLLSLPQELQDIIFELAYPEEGSAKFLNSSQWESREKQMRRENPDHLMRPFPAPKVDEFFVCKKYFESATRAWASNQHFSNDWGQAFQDIDRSVRSRPTEIVRPNITRLTLISLFPTDAENCMKNLPRLKDLLIQVSYRNFESIEPRFVWTHALDHSDFAKVEKALGLNKLRGLCSLQLLPDSCHYAATPQQQQQWVDNVQKFELHLKPLVTRVKEHFHRTRLPLAAQPCSTPEVTQSVLKPSQITADARTRRKSSVSHTTSKLLRPKLTAFGPSKRSRTVHPRSAASRARKSPITFTQSTTKQIDANSRRSQAPDVSASGRVNCRGTKRISGVRNAKARKRICLREANPSDVTTESAAEATFDDSASSLPAYRDSHVGELRASPQSEVVSWNPQGHISVDRYLETRVSGFTTALQHKPAEASHDVSSLESVRELARSNHESIPYDMSGMGTNQEPTGPSIVPIQATSLGLSNIHVLLELGPSDFENKPPHNAAESVTESTDERGSLVDVTPTLSICIGAAQEMPPSSFETNFFGKSTFTICVGAEQEILPMSQSDSLEIQQSEEQVIRDPSIRQRSSLDAMQDLVLKESGLLAKALTQLPSSGKVDVEGLPDNMEGVMEVLLKDSRGFVQLVLDAKRERLERREVAVKEDDIVPETKAELLSVEKSNYCDARMESADIMARTVVMVVRAALLFMLVLGCILLGV